MGWAGSAAYGVKSHIAGSMKWLKMSQGALSAGARFSAAVMSSSRSRSAG
jgi:hypothetical protein